MGRSRTYFGRCYCCSLRKKKKKNGSNDLPGVSWPAAGKLVPGGKVCLMSTVTKEQKVVCGWILSCLCCLPTLLWLLFQSLPISFFSISPFPFSSTTSLVRVSTRGCKDLTLTLPVAGDHFRPGGSTSNQPSQGAEGEACYVQRTRHFLMCILPFPTST